MNDVISVFCDGGARGNPGPAAAGFVIRESTGKILAKQGKFLGRATNNVAEYQAVIEALSWLKKNYPITNYELLITFFLDSKLVVNQLNGLFKIKNSGLRNLIIEVRKLEQEIKAKIFYRLIPREKNYLADGLVNQVLDKQEFY